MRNGKKIEVDSKTFEALQVILVDEWFACDHHERIKYYCGEAGVSTDVIYEGAYTDPDFKADDEYAKDELQHARDLQAAANIVCKWLTKNGARQ